MSQIQLYQSDCVVIGGGLAGIVTALELLNTGHSVTLVDAEPEHAFGGQANNAFGGMLLINTKEQQRNKIHDSPELLLQDWLRAGEFSDHDIWGQRWAKEYAYHCKTDVYDWLQQHHISFFPAVQWVERGLHGNGNSLPRYHIAWGCGRGVVQTLIRQLLEHTKASQLTRLHEHRVNALSRDDQTGAILGCSGLTSCGQPFTVQANATVVCSGGINGNLDRVKQHWDPCYGPYPANLLSGVSPAADGALHDVVEHCGGQVVNLHQMWNYAAGIAHPQPQFSQHGLSLIPPRSALWLNASGERIGPDPMVTGFDTHDLCKRTGHQEGQYTWQVMNWKIAAKELAISGTDENPLFRDKRFLAIVWQTLRGNHELVRRLVNECDDVVSAESVPELAKKMQALANDDRLDADKLHNTIFEYDEMIRRGPAFWNDDQLRKIAQLRQWRSDRLRTCKFQTINDPKAGPLIAIRERLISRKSMGGMLTNLHSQVLDQTQQPIPGLYAAGEAAGFGGGGISGIRSLEGTFLSNCILNGRRAAHHIATGKEKS